MAGRCGCESHILMHLGVDITWTMPSSSLVSLASSFLISSSMVLAWLLEADDCNLRFSDIMAAVCEAAVADSCRAVCVCARSVSSSLEFSDLSYTSQRRRAN